MRVLVTRIHRGSISTIEGDAASVNQGLAVFVCIERTDTQAIGVSLAQKVIDLRIFESPSGKLHFSVKEKQYQILCIPNFTLCADTDKGRRPSFDKSMSPEEARKLFDDFVIVLKSSGLDVQAGVFGAHMDIELELDGPVNIVLDSGK